MWRKWKYDFKRHGRFSNDKGEGSPLRTNLAAEHFCRGLLFSLSFPDTLNQTAQALHFPARLSSTNIQNQVQVPGSTLLGFIQFARGIIKYFTFRDEIYWVLFSCPFDDHENSQLHHEFLSLREYFPSISLYNRALIEPFHKLSRVVKFYGIIGKKMTRNSITYVDIGNPSRNPTNTRDWWKVHGENFIALFTTLSVVIWFSTGTLGIFATLV